MKGLLTAKSTIEEILRSHPTTPEALDCVYWTNSKQSSVRFDETIQETTKSNGFELILVLQQLNIGLLQNYSVPIPPALTQYAQHRRMVNSLTFSGEA